MSLESVFSQIKGAHAAKLAKAREAYVALVRRLHRSPDALDDEPDLLLDVLDDAGKSPSDLVADVTRYGELLRLRGLAQRHAPVSAEYDAVRAERATLREEWEQVERDYRERFSAIESHAIRLQQELRRAIDAEHDLVIHQRLQGELLELSRGGPSTEHNALRERAHALAFLPRVFFPPAPDPDRSVVRAEGCEWRTRAQPGQ